MIPQKFTLHSSFEAGQGLGNQLWIYASIRSIASKLGAKFSFHGQEHFKGYDFLDISFSSDDIDSVVSSNLRLANFYERMYYDSSLKYLGSFYDERVLSISSDSMMHGLFQSEQYLYGGLSELLENIKLVPEYFLSHSISAKTCILNIRGGEYKKHSKFILPKEYWRNAISFMRDHYDIDDFVVVTDDFRYARILFPDYDIISGSVSACFAALYHARYVVVSNSTFSYFPLRLGEKNTPKKILAPAYWGRHTSSNPRWSSVANFYTGWNWLTCDGQFLSNSAASLLVQQDVKYYLSTHNILSTQLSLPNPNLARYMPKSIKSILKKFLSFFFPLTF